MNTDFKTLILVEVCTQYSLCYCGGSAAFQRRGWKLPAFQPPGHSHSHNTCTAEPSHARYQTAPSSRHMGWGGVGQRSQDIGRLTPSYDCAVSDGMVFVEHTLTYTLPTCLATPNAAETCTSTSSHTRSQTLCRLLHICCCTFSGHWHTHTRTHTYT